MKYVLVAFYSREEYLKGFDPDTGEPLWTDKKDQAKIYDSMSTIQAAMRKAATHEGVWYFVMRFEGEL